MSATINYEVYASNGRMVYDVKKPCSEAVQLTLDGGDYTVEASIGSDKKEEKFTIGGGESKLLLDMTTITKKPTKQELIEADKQSTKPVVEDKVEDDPKQESSPVEKSTKESSTKIVEIKGIDPKDLKEAGEFLNAVLGGLLGAKQESSKETKAEQEKADKEFDEMSQELDMFTK